MRRPSPVSPPAAGSVAARSGPPRLSRRRKAAWLVIVAWASLRVMVLAGRHELLDLPARLRRARRLPAAWRRGDEAARAVARLTPFLPPRRMGPCLRQSLLLVDLLARCGEEATVHCGLRRKPAGPWEGHAWVSVDGEFFPGQPAIPPDFDEIWQA